MASPHPLPSSSSSSSSLQGMKTSVVVTSESFSTREEDESCVVAVCCRVCKKQTALYCCPRCNIRTCSLDCCHVHKVQTECSGKRDRTKFTPLSKFTDAQLRSDYHFLEEILRLTHHRSSEENNGSGTKRNPHKKKTQHHCSNDDKDDIYPPHALLLLQPSSSIVEKKLVTEISNGSSVETVVDPTLITTVGDNHNRPKDHQGFYNNRTFRSGNDNNRGKQSRLIRQALIQRDITLLLMPSGMERHDINTGTTYNHKKDLFLWRVEFIFHNSILQEEMVFSHDGNTVIKREHGPLGITNDDAITTSSLGTTIVRIALDQIEESRTIGNLLQQCLMMTKCSEKKKNAPFKELRRIDDSMLHILFKCLPCPSSNPKFVRLPNKDGTLREVLMGKTVIEFPTLDVVMERDLSLFSIS